LVMKTLAVRGMRETSARQYAIYETYMARTTRDAAQVRGLGVGKEGGGAPSCAADVSFSPPP
jgi:hypothetical protein